MKAALAEQIPEMHVLVDEDIFVFNACIFKKYIFSLSNTFKIEVIQIQFRPKTGIMTSQTNRF